MSIHGAERTPKVIQTSQPICPNCCKIAAIVRDWPQFFSKGQEHEIGIWGDFVRATDCVDCQNLVHLLGNIYLDAPVTIKPGHPKECLMRIKLRDEEAGPGMSTVSEIFNYLWHDISCELKQ